MVKNIPDLPQDKVQPDTEHKILEAATRVFMIRGKAGTSMQDIADEAGINRTLLHYYFRNKDRLFDAIFENLLHKVFPVIVSIFISDIPLFRKIELVTEKYIDLLKDKPYLPAFILQEISLNPDRLFSVVQGAGFDRTAASKYLEKQLAEEGITGMDPRHFIANFLGMVIFPFIARPMFMRIGFDNKQEDYVHFLEERKKVIPEFFRMAFRGAEQKS